MAVASLSIQPTLHTFFEDFGHPGLDQYNDLGIKLELSYRRSGIAFAYFHPLSTPYLEPSKAEPCEPLKVKGNTVLRFGFVEGSAIVSGRRVVFDPQGWKDQIGFFENGSAAEELALVLNMQELRELGQGEPANETARNLIRTKQASAVVVKNGIFGATVIDESLSEKEIPAFKSPSVFKIGTGDVFSAFFAFYWGEQNDSPENAALKASIGVANYAATRGFKSENVTNENAAVAGRSVGPVLVIGSNNSLARHYLLEEAAFRLRELGVEAQVSEGLDKATPAAVLLLSEGMRDADVNLLLRSYVNIPVIVLDEFRPNSNLKDASGVLQVNDFTSAIYHAAWATLSG